MPLIFCNILDFMEKIKIEIDLLKLETDVIHKKLLIFLGAIAGSWFYAVKFVENANIYLNLLAFLFVIIFLIATLGTFTNLIKLSKIEKEINILKGKLNDIV